MPQATAYEEWQKAPRYQLPHELHALRRDWWTTTQAAKAWGVSPRTAQRYFAEIGDTIVMARNVRTSRVRILHCVPAGTLRPPVRSRGNPNFASTDYQKANSARRWDGHITQAQRDAFEAAYDEAALLDVTEEAATFLGEDDESAEDWQPYPLPPLPDPDTEPEPECYTEKWLRDLMERKRKRQPRNPR